MRPKLSQATNDALLPDTDDESGDRIPSVVCSFAPAYMELAAVVSARTATMASNTISRAVAGTETIAGGRWLWMKRWLTTTPLAITRPTTTKNAPASGESVLISTASKRTTDAIPMKLRCSFCQLIHILAPRMTATSQAATTRI